MLTIFVALVSGFIGGLSYNTLIANTVYARFLVTTQDIGDVCANAIVKQENYLTANGPATISIVATIYDKDNVAIQPTAPTYWLAAPDDLEIKDIFTWAAPRLPPESYSRVVAANTESVRAPAISITRFRVVACSADGKPLPTESP